MGMDPFLRIHVLEFFRSNLSLSRLMLTGLFMDGHNCRMVSVNVLLIAVSYAAEDML